MYFKRTTKSEITAPAISYITVEYKKLHEKAVHGYVDMTRRAAKTIGISIKPGNVTPCEACTMAKSYQRNVPKVTKHIPAKKINGRDISASLRKKYQVVPTG
jgi:hypothetical protein